MFSNQDHACVTISQCRPVLSTVTAGRYWSLRLRTILCDCGATQTESRETAVGDTNQSPTFATRFELHKNALTVGTTMDVLWNHISPIVSGFQYLSICSIKRDLVSKVNCRILCMIGMRILCSKIRELCYALMLTNYANYAPQISHYASNIFRFGCL